MRTPENILSRWSQRKLESIGKSQSTPSSPKPSVAATERSDSNPPAALPAAQAFDPASLPPIESITAGTDIRSFLQLGVPDELARSALRRAWVSDPAIRDFIGIAESQWDFNDATAMPGFGALRADQIATLARNMLGNADDSAERIAVARAPSLQEAIEEKPLAGPRDGPAEEDDVQR
jgi:hypothetical protein